MISVTYIELERPDRMERIERMERAEREGYGRHDPRERDPRYRRSPPRHPKDMPPSSDKMMREHSREEMDGSRTLILSNLAPTTTKEEIESQFSPFGAIEVQYY